MQVEQQCYINCSGCKELGKDEQERTLFGETPDCVRDEAEDFGWTVRLGITEDEDYCPNCTPKK